MRAPLRRQLVTGAAGAGVRLGTHLLAFWLGRWHEAGVFETLHRILLSCTRPTAWTGRGLFNAITITANVNDGTRPSPDSVTDRGDVPDALPGDKGYDSNPDRRQLRKRRILQVIFRKGAPNMASGHPLERRLDLHDCLVSLICWRRLKETRP